uniref:Uncharacterized protein n=1 Tax=Arundo donax TaxID=35708 RepID=A0A0A9A633_ARUDO
MTPTALPLVL